MKLTGPPLWDLYEVTRCLQSLRDGRLSHLVGHDSDLDEVVRVYGMAGLLPLLSETVTALSTGLQTQDADDLQQWGEARGRLEEAVHDRTWPNERRLSQFGRDFRTAVEYVVELTPGVLITACEDGPTFERDWRDVKAEMLATEAHLRRVIALQNTPTWGHQQAEDARAARKIADERRNTLLRWKHY